MSEHLSAELVKRFHLQALVADERVHVRQHVMKCDHCRNLAIDELSLSIGLHDLADALAPHPNRGALHLDYETIEEYVENTLDQTESAEAEQHLGLCHECSSEVKDLRESLETIVTTASTSSNQPTNTGIQHLLLQFSSFRLQRPLRVAAIALAILAVLTVIVILRLKIYRPGEQPNSTQFAAGPSSSPGGSMSPQAISSPKPTPKQSPRKPSKISPLDVSPREEIALIDRGKRVFLDTNGNLHGLESIPNQSQLATRDALRGQTIKYPQVLNELENAQGAMRAPSGNDDVAKILYPADIVIEEERPVFSWTPANNVSGYRVEIADSRFHSVVKSDVLPPTSTSWTSSAPLGRGQNYSFVIRIFKADGERETITAPKSFRILDEDKLRELVRLKETSDSHLALGVFYAQEGMLQAAMDQFEQLIKENPSSDLPRKLLRTVQSWKK
jgi:hypothetical protein